MARSIAEIQKAITDRVAADPVLSASLTSTSRTAIWRLWTYVVAACQWTLETLFDLHKTEVTGIIDNLRPHSLRWYVNKAEAFEFGYDLVPDEDYYDNTGLTDDQIAASKVVAYAAVVEQEKNLRVKIATIVDSDLAPLPDDQKAAFTEYMSRIKDAGVKLVIDSLPADGLSLTIQVYYNPLVLDNNGARLDGTSSTPVPDAIRTYLKNLPFNGYVVQSYIVDALQAVDGVVIAVIEHAFYAQGLSGFTSMDEIYNPDSGYMRIADEDLTIIWTPQSVIK